MASSGWKRLIPVVTAVGCTAVTSIPAPAQPAHAARAAIAARKLRGGGGWQGNDAQRGVQRWDIDVTRADDDSLAGRVSVAGSPLMQSVYLTVLLIGRVLLPIRRSSILPAPNYRRRLLNQSEFDRVPR